MNLRNNVTVETERKRNMKRAGRVKKIWTSVLAGILAASCALVPAVAAETVVKPSLAVEALSLTTGKAVEGARISYYRAANLSEGGVYSLTDAFKESGLKIDEITTAAGQRVGAQLLCAYIDQKNINADGSVVTDKNGAAKREEMERGLYLLRLTDGGDEALDVEMEPFFVSLPTWNTETGTWLSSVTAAPKITTDVKETETTKPTEPDPTTPTPTDPTDPNPTNPTDPTDPSNPEPTNPTDPTNPTRPPNPGGGGGRPPVDTDGPGPGDPPLVDIPDDPVPLTSFPGTPEGPPLVEIPDDPVPLTGLPRIPKLGDMGAQGYLAGMVISLLLGGAALTVFFQTGRRKETK